MTETALNLTELENRIQKLISLHKQLKTENQKLLGSHRKLELELEQERQRYQRLEEGLASLKEEERSYTNKSISGIRKKVNEMISEIDRSVTLINAQHKK